MENLSFVLWVFLIPVVVCVVGLVDRENVGCAHCSFSWLKNSVAPGRVALLFCLYARLDKYRSARDVPPARAVHA